MCEVDGVDRDRIRIVTALYLFTTLFSDTLPEGNIKS